MTFSGRESSTQVGFASRRNSDISASYKGATGARARVCMCVCVCAHVCVCTCVCACVHVSRVLPSVLFTQNSCESQGTVPASRGCQTVPSGLSLEAPHSQQRRLEKPVEAGGLRGGGDPCPCVSGRGEGLPGRPGTAWLPRLCRASAARSRSSMWEGCWYHRLPTCLVNDMVGPPLTQAHEASKSAR